MRVWGSIGGSERERTRGESNRWQLLISTDTFCRLVAICTSGNAPACKAKAMNRASRSMGELLLVATLSLSVQHVAA